VLFSTECHVPDELQGKQSFSRILSQTVQSIKSELLETNILADRNAELTLDKPGFLNNTENIKTAAALFGADKSGICSESTQHWSIFQLCN